MNLAWHDDEDAITNLITKMSLVILRVASETLDFKTNKIQLRKTEIEFNIR